MSKIKPDLNNPDFQVEWFNLEKTELSALIRVFKRMHKLEWDQVYSIKGLNWEQIKSKQTKLGHNLYSFRFSQKYRATAYRDGDFLVMLNLHVDHDSAYSH
jgi:hypothetical protein